MPLISEKSKSRSNARNALHSQFWECEEHSARYLDGITCKLPCEPTSLSMTSPSGISRSQQLVAAQSVGIPFIPSYDGHGGGVVCFTPYICAR